MIYADHWRLAFAPFSDDERTETFVPVRSATLAIARLRYALGREMGASGIFGEAGLGKTRLGRMLIDEFVAAGWNAAYLPGPRGTAGELLSRLRPGSATLPGMAASDLLALEDFIADRAAAGQPALLVVDDVQASRSVDFLETLRTLLNVRHAGKPALSVLLMGQPAMARRLAEASGFDGQLAVRALLEPMTDEETRVYILARLKAAGSSQGIFTRHAADRVVDLGGGNPRRVNRLCEMSLVVAYGLGENKVGPGVVDMAAADLDLLPGQDAPFHPWPHPEPETGTEEGEAGEDILASLPGGG